MIGVGGVGPQYKLQVNTSSVRMQKVLVSKMPSEPDAASETVAEAIIDAVRCARSSVDVEELIDAMLRKGHNAKISPDGTITLWHKMRRKACKTSRGGSVASRGEVQGDTVSPVRSETAKQIRDKQRNTRERYEMRVLKRLEMAKKQRWATIAGTKETKETNVMNEETMPQVAPAVPERQASKAGAVKRLAIEKVIDVKQVIETATTTRASRPNKKYGLGEHEVKYKSKGIARMNKSKSETTSYASAAYKALTRGERMLNATCG